MEIEVKFSPADAGCFQAMLADRALSRPAAPLLRLEMKTIYYDDPAHILSAHGLTAVFISNRKCSSHKKQTGISISAAIPLHDLR